ncbi:unnamed protein product [Ectocarpus fasciculatus]
MMDTAIGAEPNMSNRWKSVMEVGRCWPGEYQNSADSDGCVHGPWSGNLNYFECCTGAPLPDETRASAFVATSREPIAIARKLVKAPCFGGRTLRVERRDNDYEDDDYQVHVKEGSAILFSIHRVDDAGVGGKLCTITAFSSDACASLCSEADTFNKGTCCVVPHGRFESTVDTKLGPKRLVRVVGIDKNATDSDCLAAHLTIEDDSAVAYQPPPAQDSRTLADHVVSRCIMSFRNGGWDSCVSPTIESIMTRRDYHGNDLAKCLFGVVEDWFLREWTLDIKEGGRMIQATQLTNLIVDGVPTPLGGGGSDSKEDGPTDMIVDGDSADVEPGTCRGLTAVTDKQLFYNMLGFVPNPPGEGSMAEMLSVNHRKEDEAMKLHLASSAGPVNVWASAEAAADWKSTNMRWRSCDSCLVTETKENPLKVCSRCSCERYCK